MNTIVSKVAVGTIKESRELRIQPFNEYRKRFNLEPYTSFRDFTGKTDGCCETHATPSTDYLELDLQLSANL